MDEKALIWKKNGFHFFSTDEIRNDEEEKEAAASAVASRPTNSAKGGAKDAENTSEIDDGKDAETATSKVVPPSRNDATR